MSLDPIKAEANYTAPAPTAVEPVTLRRATADDASALALAAAATFLEAFTWMLPGRDLVAHCAKNHVASVYAGYLAQPNTRCTLAEAGPFPGNQSPIGYTILCDPELPTIDTLPTDAELKRIYLLSRFRSSPVVDHPNRRPAEALLDLAIADARTLNRTRLLLGVNDGNHRALNFYYRNGFVSIGTRTFNVGSLTCSDLILAKDL
ncbi:N-acetyltransferase [Granulicella sp. 5B5]|uniref:GNAT family N-acetyltransferase n=1 Tax=Granulicella sp. 5B5 TaxID=1617967 RepID=UPI002106D43D|nr:N-acetyltransferase [Granulicella sp. 5B5]